MQKKLLVEFFEAHDQMLSKSEFGVTKEELVEKAIEKVAADTKTSVEDLVVISKQITFPEISFVVNDEFAISIYDMDEDGRGSVNPTLYYKEPFNEFMKQFYTAKFNALLIGTEYEVCIFQTEDYYEPDEDDSEDMQYDDLPMFEANIIEKETEEEVEDTTTGRYCSIIDVIEELESIIYDLLESPEDK